MDKENKLFLISILCILVGVFILKLSGDTSIKLNEISPYVGYPALVFMSIGVVTAVLWFVEIVRQK